MVGAISTVARLGRWRRRMLDGLGELLLHAVDSKERVESAAAFLEPLLPQLAQTREDVIEKYADQFSARELDQELGIKSLVTVAGGGGSSASAPSLPFCWPGGNRVKY